MSMALSWTFSSLDSDADEIFGPLSNAKGGKLHAVGHMMPWFDHELFLREVGPFILGG